MAFHPVYWMTDCGSTEEAMHRNEGTDGPIHTGSPCHRHVGVSDCGMVCRPAVSPSPQEEQESCQQKAPVAQSDRAIDFESKGRGFDSLQARHLYPGKYGAPIISDILPEPLRVFPGESADARFHRYDDTRLLFGGWASTSKQMRNRENTCGRLQLGSQCRSPGGTWYTGGTPKAVGG